MPLFNHRRGGKSIALKAAHGKPDTGCSILDNGKKQLIAYGKS
jgi:hypothetical protein